MSSIINNKPSKEDDFRNWPLEDGPTQFIQDAWEKEDKAHRTFSEFLSAQIHQRPLENPQPTKRPKTEDDSDVESTMGSETSASEESAQTAVSTKIDQPQQEEEEEKEEIDLTCDESMQIQSTDNAISASEGSGPKAVTIDRSAFSDADKRKVLKAVDNSDGTFFTDAMLLKIQDISFETQTLEKILHVKGEYLEDYLNKTKTRNSFLRDCKREELNFCISLLERLKAIKGDRFQIN